MNWFYFASRMFFKNTSFPNVVLLTLMVEEYRRTARMKTLNSLRWRYFSRVTVPLHIISSAKRGCQSTYIDVPKFIMANLGEEVIVKELQLLLKDNKYKINFANYISYELRISWGEL